MLNEFAIGTLGYPVPRYVQWDGTNGDEIADWLNEQSVAQGSTTTFTASLSNPDEDGESHNEGWLVFVITYPNQPPFRTQAGPPECVVCYSPGYPPQYWANFQAGVLPEAHYKTQDPYGRPPSVDWLIAPEEPTQQPE